jgi:hypothetical protein
MGGAKGGGRGGGGAGKWDWKVARRERGVAKRNRDVARWGGGAQRGFVGAGHDGRVSEREGRRDGRGGCPNKGEG